jgi:poly-gamma-glutamate capsule biosynthesis protein CapA/YwtB (metallophosphatase superfamily)
MRRHRLAVATTAVVAVSLLTGCASSTEIRGLDDVSTTGTAAPSGTSTSGSGTPSSTSTATSGSPRQVTITATGDVRVDAAIRASAERASGTAGIYDFDGMLAAIRPIARGSDVALCHLGTPLSASDIDLSVADSTVLNAPREVARTLAWAGFTGCDGASAHAYDLGVDGLADTFRVFQENGLGYTGPGAAQSNGRRVATYRTDAATVSHLAYTYAVSGDEADASAPSEARWLKRSLWPSVKADGIIADAAAARAAGADFVVVSLNWGATAATDSQKEFATSLLDSADIDLVIGTNPRAIQQCAKINGKYVFYSLGELLADGQDTEGLTARVTLTRDAFGNVDSTAGYLATTVAQNSKT